MKKDYEDEYERHPSYGMIQINRVSAARGDGGGINLFGSAMRHGHFFALRITDGERSHNLGSDMYTTVGGLPHVEIYLSPAQFVSMITTMNHGQGVPCTINRIGSESIEDCPPQETEGERIRKAFKEEVLETAAKLAVMLSEADEVLNKKAIGKADRGILRGIIHKAKRFFDDHAPFAADQFEHATDKLTAKAKAEVEDFITTAIQRAGIKSLTGGESDGVEILQLPDMSDKDEPKG